MKPGTRLRSTVCDTSIVIVRTAGDAAIECGGQAMVDATTPVENPGQPAEGFAQGTVVGKRYEDPESGLEVLCVKAGAGSLSVDGRLLTIKDAKPLPSSD